MNPSPSEKISNAHLNKIKRMLLEMASGNFSVRLKRSKNHDNLEALTIVLNMLAEEMQEIMIQQGHPSVEGKVRFAIQMNFLLDPQGKIELVNKHTCTVLSYHLKDFMGRPFGDFLDGPSTKRWQQLQRKLTQRKFFDKTLDVNFLTKPGLLIPCTCHISSCIGNPFSFQRTVVTIVRYSREMEEHEKTLVEEIKNFEPAGKIKKNAPIRTQTKLSFEDIRKIREGRNLILNNLEGNLPSLKEFAHQLGTNEFKLKYGFRQLYGTSVFRFLLQERLRKSKMLIQHTDYPIKTIAYKTGFKSIPHFSRVFKKTYGYTPSALRKSLRKEA